jgi:gamma-glutamyl hercynylcysteine S-oxide hydrolase
MCRHLAYLGPPVRLSELLLDPPHSLLRQSWQPRRQRQGLMNADGFGVGWYAVAADGAPATAAGQAPARYRRDLPMWADANLASIARVVRSGVVLAAVRSATDGMARGEGAVAPFGDGPWLFSHNGRVDGWPDSAAPLAAQLPAADLVTLDAASDSALLWALTRSRLEKDPSLPGTLAAVVELAAPAGGRLNLLLTDGASVAATAWGDSLCYLADPAGQRGVVVASEPHDDDLGWTDVPDRSLLVATAEGVTLTPL